MVKVVARAIVKVDKIGEYKQLAAELAAETRKEKGCISYELYQDIGNDRIFSFIETWESRELLDNHMKSKHFQEIVPKLGQNQEEDSEVNVYRLVL